MSGMLASENQAVSAFVAGLNGHPWIAILTALVLTAILQASAATIGLAITLTTVGLLTTESALFVVAGANIGTVATAIISSSQGGFRGRRVAAAHIITRLVGAAFFIAFMPIFLRFSGAGTLADARAIANANTLFSVALFIIAMPFIYQVRLAALRIIPVKPYHKKPILEAKFLEAKFIEYPAIALEQSWKEINRINRFIKEMMSEIRILITENEFNRVQNIKRRERYVDSIVGQTVSYLVRVSQGKVPDHLSKKLVEQLFILDNLESIADSLKRIGGQLAKRIETNVTFSEEGAAELQKLHTRTATLLTRLQKILQADSLRGLGKLRLEALEMESAEEKLKLSHFRRLMSGKPESEESTTIHMELLNLYLRVVSSISIIAGMPREVSALEELDFEESDFEDIVE
jgi:phosphate:Na+ symporter